MREICPIAIWEGVASDQGVIVLQVALLHLGASLSPGPDILLTIRNSLLYGRKAGRATVLGIVCGVTIQVVLCLVGLAWVLSRLPLAFQGIALVGGTYLMWIGWDGLRRREKTLGVELQKVGQCGGLRGWAYFRQGLLTNLLNPKAILYFIGLFSIVLTEGVSARVRVSSGVVMVGVQLVAFWMVAGWISTPRVRGWLQRYQWRIARVLGVLLILFGGRLIYSVFW